MTFSHDLVQKIGGREDTNENTTRRVLLIQESKAFGKPDAHTRTLKHIFSRYLKDDRGLRYGSLPFKVPRILENGYRRFRRQAKGTSRARMGPEECKIEDVPKAHFRHRHAQLFQLRNTERSRSARRSAEESLHDSDGRTLAVVCAENPA